MASFADRLCEALEKRDMKAADLARLTHTPESVISQYKKGMYKPKQRRTEEIAKALDVSIEWLVGADVPMERVNNIIPLKKQSRVPLLGKIACGAPILATQNVEEMLLLPDNVKADFALTCKGDSMIDARIHDGDVVFVQMQPEVENGEIAAVRIGDEATLKRFYKKGNTIILQPENKQYEPLIFSAAEINNADIEIIGKATYFLSKVQ